MNETPGYPNELVADFLIARGHYEKAKMDLEDAQTRLMKQMEADQRKSFRWTTDGVNRNITFVQQQMTIIDEPGLRKALTAKVFDRYTKRVLDRAAMERAMDDGEDRPGDRI